MPGSTRWRRKSAAGSRTSAWRRGGRASQPIVGELEKWIAESQPCVPAKSPIGKALAYFAHHWEGLTLFLGDGRIEIDNNSLERSIRPVALTRKNSLFAGNESAARDWAVLASLIETCRLNDVNPQEYLTWTLDAICAGHKQSRIDELLPWSYAGLNRQDFDQARIASQSPPPASIRLFPVCHCLSMSMSMARPGCHALPPSPRQRAVPDLEMVGLGTALTLYFQG